MKLRIKNYELRIIILSLLIIHSLIVHCQDTWIQTYQPFGDVDYYPEDIVVCQDGGYAVNGYYYYFDGMWEEQWGFLMKTDSDGILLWAHTDEVDFMSWNESYAFVETSEGDFISKGYDYGGGYMIKRDSIGNRLWAIPYNDFGANSMANTNDNNGTTRFCMVKGLISLNKKELRFDNFQIHKILLQLF